MALGTMLILGGILPARAPAADLLPYGSAAGDTATVKSDDAYTNVSWVGRGPAGTSPVLNFMRKSYNSIFINNNGCLSFDQGVSAYSSTPFPLTFNLIAPLWCDVDTRAAGGGTVWYRIEQDTADLAEMSTLITTQTSGATGFHATFALVVTWDHVGYYSLKADKLNTFQVVIVTDGIQTYILFLYPPGGINWLQGEVPGSGFPSMGITSPVASSYSYYSHPLSGTANLANLTDLSNTTPGTPGLFIFRVDGPAVSAAPAPSTLTASPALSAWGPGSGTWTGDSTTWWNGANAVWGGTARSISMSGFDVTVNELQLNTSGLTFTGITYYSSSTYPSVPTKVEFQRLLLPSAAGEVIFSSGAAVAAAPNAISQGIVQLRNGAILAATAAGAVNGGTLNLRQTSRVDACAADSMTTQTAVIFDSSFGGTGGTLDLHGFSVGAGSINSVGTGGLITNSGSSAAMIEVGGNGTSDFRGSIANGTAVTGLTKSGTGTLSLLTASSYSGRTVITGGTLAVNGGSIGSTSSVDVQNGALTLSNTTLNTAVSVGQNLGTAALNITSTTLTTTGFNAALEPGTMGNITLSSGTWTNSGGFALANFGAASLTVNGGSLSTDAMTLGHDGGTATVALNGGVVTTGEIARWSVGSSISFGGGTLRAAADSAALLNGFTTGSAVLNAGGLTIDTNSRTVSIPAEFSGAGGLAKTGAGRLTLTGSSTYTGDTFVSAGELQVDGAISSSAVTLAGTASLRGTGQTGAVTLTESSTVEPGNPGAAGSLRAAGLAWNGGSMVFDLGASNAASDHLFLAGPLTGTASSKVFTFSGAVPGMIYDLITFTSTTLTAADFTASGATGVFVMSGTTLRFFVGQIADSGQHWRIKHFGLLEKSGAAADAADPDHDGLANLLEFAFSQDPVAPGTAARAGKINGAFFEFTFLRDDAAEPLISLKVGVSSDLTTWIEIPIEATSSSSGGVTITVLENGADPDTITVQIPTAEGSRLFSRVSATSL